MINASRRVVPVKVIYEFDELGPNMQKEWILDLSMTPFEIESQYINQRAGIDLSDEEILDSLSKMMYSAKLLSPGKISVAVSPSRTDVLHACDIMEDVAIQYGYSNIIRTVPKTFTFGEEMPLNKLTDAVRLELAIAGFTESLTLTLCSVEENGPFLRQEAANIEAVHLSNPMTAEFQVVRTSLLPGLLKTLASNKAVALPLKIFEVSDVVLTDATAETGARNERRIGVFYCGTSTGFELIHGTLDRLMAMLGVSPLASTCHPEKLYYSLVESKNETFFPGRRVDVVLHPSGSVIGTMGVIHPDVLNFFEVSNVASGLELLLEPFL